MEPTYEEARKLRMEENKKRMEELGLMQLSTSMKKPKTVRMYRKRPTLEEQGLERRRSTRVAAIQAQEELRRAQESDESDDSDKEASVKSVASSDESEAESDPDSEPGSPVVRTRYTLRRNRKTPPREISDGQVEATEAAEDIEKELENPGFVVSLLDAHVSTDFLEVPEKFRKRNLPEVDEKVALEDEDEKEWESTFLASSGVLGDGWSKFVKEHKLEAGDACVFELLSANKFKVHLVRASEHAGAIAAGNSSAKRVKREEKVKREVKAKVVDGEEVVEVDETSGVENNEDGSGDDWRGESSSEEEGEEEEEEDDDDNWRPDEED